MGYLPKALNQACAVCAVAWRQEASPLMCPVCYGCQGFVFINLDPDMKDPKTGESARCRNSGLNEDLGKVRA